METFINVKGETVYNALYSKGIMKQLGNLDAQLLSDGYRIFLDEIFPAHQLDSELNHHPISELSLIGCIYEAGYLAGIRAERAKKKAK